MGDRPTPDPVHPSSLLRTPDLHARTPTVRHSLHTTIQKGSSMSTKIYVGNLPYSVTDSSLQSNFAEFGGVSSAKVMMDRETGRSKGFGFVEMASAEVAQVDASKRAFNLAQKRYDSGYSGYSDLLDTQRTLNTAQLLYLASRKNRLGASVDLFKALGGG